MAVVVDKIKHLCGKLLRYAKVLVSNSPADNFRYLKWRLSRSKAVTIRCKGSDKWAYVSYIPEALLRRDTKYINGHQACREMRVMASVLHKAGYNIVVQSYLASHVIRRKFDLVLGLQPNFNIQKRLNPEAVDIYLATGAYLRYANSAVESRTASFNAKYGTDILPRRLTHFVDEPSETAGRILQIGSKYTIETYAEDIRPKITLIDQSSTLLHEPSIADRLDCFDSNKFLWIGSGGTILKGVDLVLEYFLEHPEYEIDMVGPVEEDVKAVFESRLRHNPQIRFHGFVDTNSEKFKRITRDTSFLIYPSCTEGGPPGAVNVAMKMGLVPILSKVASPDYIDTLGYRLDDLSADAVARGVEWSQGLSRDKIKELMRANHEYARRWSLENFEREFADYMAKVTGLNP